MRGNLTSWQPNPSQGIGGLRNEMDTLLQRFFGDGEGSMGDLLTPRMNVAETAQDIEVTLEIPGVKPEEIDVEVHNNQLVIRGEKKRENEVKEKSFHRVERSYGKFQRVVALGIPVEEEKVTARFADGVLTVSIPKAEKAKPKKISISN